LEEKVVKVEDGLNQIRGERLDQQTRMEVEIKKVRDELQEIKNCSTGGSGKHTDEAESKKLQKEMEGMKVEIESVGNNSVRNVWMWKKRLKLKEENAIWLFMGCQKPMHNRMWDVWWK
jgi:hypothetical protein